MQQRPHGDHTTLPAYLRLFGGREEKAHCEQMVAPIFSEIMLRAYERTRLSHSRWSPHARRVTFYIRGFSRFVTSTTAPTAASQLIFFEPLQLYNQTLPMIM